MAVVVFIVMQRFSNILIFNRCFMFYLAYYIFLDFDYIFITQPAEVPRRRLYPFFFFSSGTTRSSNRGKSRGSGGSSSSSYSNQPISVDDLPVNGHAVSLTNRRPGTNSREQQEPQKTYSRYAKTIWRLL